MKNKTLLFLIIGGLVYFGVSNDPLGAEKVYPSKSIELVCPIGAGGSTSMSGRVIAGTLTEYIGAPVVVIHKTGAYGTVGTTYVAKSKPDGYTLLITITGPMAISPSIRKIDYKIQDFELLCQYAIEPMGLVVRSDAPWKTVEELVADIKKAPGTFKYATDGVGTPSHVGIEFFKKAVGGLKMDAVPFLSGLETGTAVLGGHVQMTYAYLVSVKGAYEAGKIRILALGTDKRLEDYPGVPTFSEIGYPEVKWCPWYGVGAPIKVPKQVSDKLKEALYKTAQNPEVQKLLSKIGFTPSFMDGKEFTKVIQEENKKVFKLVEAGDIKKVD
jgi:tripartite-type tricarboxylate transporter receptor subunit TctC